MKQINSKLIQELIVLAPKKLEGDWVLMGGTLLHYFMKDYRVTTDIDLVPISERKGNRTQLQSFDLAHSLGLPVECINGAALFFLEKTKGYKNELILMHEWKGGRIFRPNLFLFFQLKLSRLSETDAQDCIEFLRVDLPEKNEQMIKLIKGLVAKQMKAHSNEKLKLLLLTQIKKALAAQKG